MVVMKNDFRIVLDPNTNEVETVTVMLLKNGADYSISIFSTAPTSCGTVTEAYKGFPTLTRVEVPMRELLSFYRCTVHTVYKSVKYDRLLCADAPY